MFIGALPVCTSVWGHQIPWNWSCRQMWVLGIELPSSGRAGLKLLSHFSRPYNENEKEEHFLLIKADSL